MGLDILDTAAQVRHCAHMSISIWILQWQLIEFESVTECFVFCTTLMVLHRCIYMLVHVYITMYIRVDA